MWVNRVLVVKQLPESPSPVLKQGLGLPWEAWEHLTLFLYSGEVRHVQGQKLAHWQPEDFSQQGRKGPRSVSSGVLLGQKGVKGKRVDCPQERDEWRKPEAGRGRLKVPSSLRSGKGYQLHQDRELHSSGDTYKDLLSISKVYQTRGLPLSFPYSPSSSPLSFLSRPFYLLLLMLKFYELPQTPLKLN